MILIGMFDSPFVRRVAISMRVLGVQFEHHNWSVGKDFERIRAYNPLGRVPTLVLDDGESLFESSAILDWLDEAAGPQRALIPPAGAPRRRVLKLVATAVGAADKGVLQVYESVFRPPECRHAPWVERCAAQTGAALAELDAACAACKGAFLVGGRLSQADITATCVMSFAADALGFDAATVPHLRDHAARFEALPEFQEFRISFHRPNS